MPATIRWSSSASPIARRRRHAAPQERRRIERSPITSGPSAASRRSKRVRDSRISSSTGPSNWTRLPAAARSTSQAASRRASARALGVNTPQRRSCAGASAASARRRSAATGACRARRPSARRGRRVAPASGRPMARMRRQDLLGRTALEHRAKPSRRVVDRVALGHAHDRRASASAGESRGTSSTSRVASATIAQPRFSGTSPRRWWVAGAAPVGPSTVKQAIGPTL